MILKLNLPLHKNLACFSQIFLTRPSSS